MGHISDTATHLKLGSRSFQVIKRAVVVDQLAECSLLTPYVHGSNPDIGKILYSTFVVFCLHNWKDKIKKECGNGPFKKGSKMSQMFRITIDT